MNPYRKEGFKLNYFPFIGPFIDPFITNPYRKEGFKGNVVPFISSLY